ncbi:hypothetical protein VaNZ11_002610, partial [Volvox africanus]
SAVASLAVRAERLVRAVDAISAGVADTAAMLSPGRRVLQIPGPEADLSGAAADVRSIGREMDSNFNSSELIPPAERPATSNSPTRRVQADGSLAVHYDPQGLMAGRVPSPPGSPRRNAAAPSGQGGIITSSRHPSPLRDLLGGGNTGSRPVSASTEFTTLDRSVFATAGGIAAAADGKVSATTMTAETIAAAAMRSPRRSPRLRKSRSMRGLTAGVAAPGVNSVQVLLSSGLPGGRLVRDEPRSYGHVGSRLHEETASTMAKKRKPGTPAAATSATAGMATTSSGRCPTAELTPLGPSGLRVLPPGPPPPAVVTSAWPHVPATMLPSSSAGGAGGPHTADLLMRRGEVPDPTIPLETTIEIAPPAAAAAQQAPVVA